MPTPSRSSIKNATGILRNSPSVAKQPHLHRFASTRQPSATAPPSSTPAKNIHLAPLLSKERLITPNEANRTPAPANPPDLLAHLTASAWSTSPVNTGNPFFEDNDFSPLATAPEPPLPARIADAPIDLAAIFWTTSPANPGGICDSLFTITPTFGIPARSVDAYDNIMASDEDYAAFLDKAASDRQPVQQGQSKVVETAQNKVNTQSLHPALQNVHQHTYVSDADEAFEPISLQRASGKNGAVDKKEVAQFADAKEGDVEEQSMSHFDPRGEYKPVVKQVEDASTGGVKVWRIEKGGARAEYWILGVSKDGHVVGARAKAVES